MSAAYAQIYMKNTFKYADIFSLSRPKCVKPMSLSDRAAQFAPFSALTGLDASLNEGGRKTEEKRTLDDLQKEEINSALTCLSLDPSPPISLTFFVQDEKKEGGHYETCFCHVKKIDEYNQTLMLKEDFDVLFSDIFQLQIIRSNIFPTLNKDT